MARVSYPKVKVAPAGFTNKCLAAQRRWERSR
jgi:hypothetical protein